MIFISIVPKNIWLKQGGKMIEKTIEKKVCDYAKTKRMIVYKMNPLNNRGIPDRLFLTAGGDIFFIEFKQLGKKPNENQAREIARLRANNIDVYVIDNVDDGKKVIDHHA